MSNKLAKLNVSIVFRAESGYTSEHAFKSGVVEPNVILISAAEELARMAALSGVGAEFLEAVNNQIKALNEPMNEEEDEL